MLTQKRIEKNLQILFFAGLGIYFINFVLLGFIIGPLDYDHLAAYYLLAARFWKENGLSLPHFNPFLSGGRPLGADPQIPIYNPLTLLVPLLGAVWVIKLEIFGQLLGGLYGLKKLLEKAKSSPSQIYFALFCYLAGGGVVARAMIGHFTLGFFTLFPLFIWMSMELEKKKKPRFVFYYFLLFYYCSLYKPNFFIQGVPLLLFEVVVRSWITQNKRPLIFFGIAIGICIFTQGVIILPSLFYFKQMPRTGVPVYLISWQLFILYLLLPIKTLPRNFYEGLWFLPHEFAHFVGLIPIILAIRGFWLTQNKTLKISLGSLFLFSLILGFGASSEKFNFWPYSWFYTLWPGFNTLRVPVRFWYGVYFVLIFFAALGFPKIKKKSHLIWILCLGYLPLFLNESINIFKTSVQYHQTQWTASTENTHWEWKMGKPDDTYQWVKKGFGALNTVYNIESFSERVIEGPYFPEILKTTPKNWSEFEIEGVLKRERIVEINLSHSPFWKFEGQGEIVSTLHQRLTLEAEGSHIRGTLKYRLPFVQEGFLMTACGILLLLGIGVWAFKNPKLLV